MYTERNFKSKKAIEDTTLTDALRVFLDAIIEAEPDWRLSELATYTEVGGKTIKYLQHAALALRAALEAPPVGGERPTAREFETETRGDAAESRRLSDLLVLGAAVAVLRHTDWEANLYTAQSAVENWALAALEAALTGNRERALLLLSTYNDAPWDDSDGPDWAGEFRSDYDYEDWMDR